MNWKFTALPPKSKAGCNAEGCHRYADYEAAMQKKNGLFRFVWKVCAYHKLVLQNEKLAAHHLKGGTK